MAQPDRQSGRRPCRLDATQAVASPQTARHAVPAAAMAATGQSSPPVVATGPAASGEVTASVVSTPSPLLARQVENLSYGPAAAGSTPTRIVREAVSAASPLNSAPAKVSPVASDAVFTSQRTVFARIGPAANVAIRSGRGPGSRRSKSSLECRGPQQDDRLHRCRPGQGSCPVWSLMELRQVTTENHPAAATGFPELGSATAAGPFLGRLAEIIKYSSLFRDASKTDRYLAARCPRSPSLPAAVTPPPKPSSTAGDKSQEIAFFSLTSGYYGHSGNGGRFPCERRSPPRMSLALAPAIRFAVGGRLAVTVAWLHRMAILGMRRAWERVFGRGLGREVIMPLAMATRSTR